MPLILLNAWILLPASAANDPPPSPVMVCEVNFSGGATVWQDDPSTMPIPYPHWEDKQANASTGDPHMDAFPDGIPDENRNEKGELYSKPNQVKSYMYSYQVRQIPSVSAEFKWYGGPPPVSQVQYWCKGDVVDTPNSCFRLPCQRLINNVSYPVDSSYDTITVIPAIQGYVTSNRLVERNGVSGLKPIKIRWTVTDHPNPSLATKTYVSYSSHTIYVTWKSLAVTPRETVLNLACEMANGMTAATIAEENAVASRIFEDFTDLKVRRMDDAILTYYRKDNEYRSAMELLEYGDGQCGAFCDLLSGSVSCAGVDSDFIKITPIFSGTEPRMLVKNWTFNQGSLPAPWTHRFSLDKPEESDVTPLPEGVKGQGDINPVKKRFRLHYLVSQSGRYFDPSYGKVVSPATGSPQLIWESDSLDGFDVFGTYPVSDNPLVFGESINVARREDSNDVGTIFTVFDP